MSLKSRFCPKCGKETEKLLDSLCSSCYSGKPNVKVPNQKNVLQCVKCDMIYNKGFWTRPKKDIESYLIKRIRESIRLPDGETLVDVKLLELGKDAELLIRSEVGDEKLERTINGKFEIKKYCCPACSREQGIDYTAKLQLRATKDHAKFVEEALSYIREAAPKVSKVEPMLKGVDVYLVNQRLAKQAARRIKKHLEVTMRESYRNYSWDHENDRPKRRITILLKQKLRK